MLIVIPILAALFAPALWLILGRARFVTVTHATLSTATVSIIIPARNEENNIGALLESITSGDIQPTEIIVVDDASTDRTAAIAREHGATVISPPQLPSDWKGKPWACHNGAVAATSDWLLFLDADTRIAPGGYAKIYDLTHRADRVYSICPYHTIGSLPEELSAFFNVIMLAGVNAFGIQRDPANHAALFGQCLLISRTHYHNVGGHHSVRAEILENFHLASHLAAQHIPRECYLGRGCITMRMFPGGFTELWASWKKGFTSGASHAAPIALILTSVWITGAMSAIVGLTLIPFASTTYCAAAIGIYLLYALQCLRVFRLAGTFSLLNAFLFPISLLFYQTLFFTAIIERKRGIKTQWKGRHVD